MSTQDFIVNEIVEMDGKGLMDEPSYNALIGSLMSEFRLSRLSAQRELKDTLRELYEPIELML